MIAVTGATGLLGNFVVKKLIESREPFVALKRKESRIDSSGGLHDEIQWRNVDLLDPGSVYESLEGVTGVIHSAALVSFSRRLHKKIFATNLEGTRNIVNACLERKIPRLLYVSSIAALGRSVNGNILSETNQWTADPNISVYAESKYLGELEVLRGQEEGISTVIVNPSLILSPHDWTRSSGKLFRYIQRESPFYIDGFINFVDARDVAEVIYRLFHSSIEGERFVVSAGSISIHEFMQISARLMNKKPPGIKIGKPIAKVLSALEWLSFRSEPVVTREIANQIGKKIVFTNDKIKKALNFEFQTIDETLRWCCVNGSYAEKEIL